jgi:HEAT repeat protein
VRKLGIFAFAVSTTASLPALAKPVVAVAPAADRQPALAVGFDAQGALRARICAKARCDVDGATEIPIPAQEKNHFSNATLKVVRFAPARRAIVVEVPSGDPARRFKAVVTAPLSGAREPTIVFAGETGYTDGEWGERHGAMVTVSEARPDGTRSILVGEQREDLALCRRPTILAPRLLSAKDLKLHPARVQRLTPEERGRAPHLTAARVEQEATVPVLRARGASSAVGRPDALTDGDPETTWAENRGGDGRGELVVMSAPSQLPLTGFEFVVRPPKAEPERAVAPKELWIATDHELFLVTLPEDGWKNPGARYAVKLDRPVQTECVAVVVESAWGGDKHSRVTLAEVSATTEFDATKVEGLVGALAGGGERAEAAGTALAALGGEAFEAVKKRFSSLDEGGRRVALDVIDHADCQHSAPVYVEALLGPYRAHRIHAEDHLRRCPEEGGAELAKALSTAPPLRLVPLAEELALIAPSRAVAAILPHFAKSRRKTRAALRVALARATRSPKAAAAVRAALVAPKTGITARIELLRALGDRISGFRPEASTALGGLLGPKASFRTRYLLLAPAAELSASDPAARAYLERSLRSDQSPYVRTHAAEVMDDPARFRGALLAALSDGEVRVREAAVGALSKPAGSFAKKGLLARLGSDRWPLVRAAAAQALAKHGADETVDAALARAVADSSAAVRAPAVVALGHRGATKHAGAVRERLDDDEETPEVQGAAALALGLLCDRESIDVLTDRARKLSDPMLSPEARAVSVMALGALSRIHPSDLAERVKPLRAKNAPVTARAAADAALRSPGHCGAQR